MKVEYLFLCRQLGKPQNHTLNLHHPKGTEISQPQLDTHFTEWYRNRSAMEHKIKMIKTNKNKFSSVKLVWERLKWIRCLLLSKLSGQSKCCMTEVGSLNLQGKINMKRILHWSQYSVLPIRNKNHGKTLIQASNSIYLCSNCSFVEYFIILSTSHQ